MRILIFFVISWLAGCAAMYSSSGNDELHGGWWKINIHAPLYMESWVEAVLVDDIEGHRWVPVIGGVVGHGSRTVLDQVHGWGPVGGTGQVLTGAMLPKRIHVRWQSLVESRTYHGWLEVTHEMREAMKDSTARRCADRADEPAEHMASITISMAPGGIIQSWVKNSCFRNIPYARTVVHEHPLGPYLGAGEGKYYPLSETSKGYIERWGIPYGTW